MLPDLEDYDGDLTKKKRPPKKKALSDIILLNLYSFASTFLRYAPFMIITCLDLPRINLRRKGVN
jgi:hypothetical protein